MELEPILYNDPMKDEVKELYASDSQVKTFQKTPWEWFDDKILRLPRTPQLPVMAVGSSFDSFCKHDLAYALYGKDHPITIEMAGQFESSVETHNRDQARLDGMACLTEYKACGRYDELLAHLQSAEAVYFESDVRRPMPPGHKKSFHAEDCYSIAVDVYEIDEEASKLAGKMQIRMDVAPKRKALKVIVKPDLLAIFKKDGMLIPEILDWKCNGFYSGKGATIQPQNFVDPDTQMLVKSKQGYRFGPHGLNPEHKMSWPIPAEWSAQLHLYAQITLVHRKLMHEFPALNDLPPFDVHVSIDQLAWFPDPRRMEVYQYHSENNGDWNTRLHARFSMFCTAITNGWWDPFCGSKTQIQEKARGRISSAADPVLAALCRTR